MTTSTLHQKALHVGIIMDGNGRWAAGRGLPRIAGHRAGAESLRRVVEASPGMNIGTLTLYAFSSDNWRRPSDEVAALMELLEAHLLEQTEKCRKNGVRLEVIGRRDRLPLSLISAIRSAESVTAGESRLRLRLAVDYSARDAIFHAVSQVESREAMTCVLGPDVDLLIRTGGEQRLSDFLLWECAYAELVFSKRMWPDFDALDLDAAIREFHSRERRFGGLLSQGPGRNGHAATRPASWLD